MARSGDLGSKGSRFVVLASVCLVVAALYFARDVFIPLSLAVLLSFLLTPPVRWLERWRLPRIAATLIVVCLGLALAVSIGYLVGNQIKSVVEQLPNYQGELRTKLDSIKRHGGFFRKAEQEIHNISSASTTSRPAAAVVLTAPLYANPLSPVPNLRDAQAPGTQPSTENPLPVRIVNAPPSYLELIGQYSTKFLDPLATAGLVLILVIFMLLMRDDLRDRIIRLVGHGRLNLTTQALDEAGTRISRYLGALAIVNFLYGVFVATGLWAIGHFLGHGKSFPNVLVWGLLVGLFRFVPYLGIWLGASIPLLLSFALFPGSAVFFGVLALFVALELVVSQFVEPYWYGASTGMSALAVLVAAVVWTWLWGPIGLLLSTPLTVCLVVLGKYVPELQFLDILLGDEPVLPPHVRLYQRLIAGDDEEAAEMARDLLEEKPIEAVYDDVLLPALVMAEHDHHQGRLDPERLAFIHQSIRDIVDELGDEARTKAVREAAAATEHAAKGEKPDPDLPAPRPALRKDCTVNVLCLPAKGEADEIAAVMLKQLLELRGYFASSTSADSLASEMVEMIEKLNAQIVCVSAMPPAAIAHARYLCKRIHSRYPTIGMAVGIWRTRADPQKIKRRIACSDAATVVATLAQMVEQIDQLSHGFVGQDTPAAEPAAAS